VSSDSTEQSSQRRRGSRRPPRGALLPSILLLAVAASGCAGLRAQEAAEARLQAELDRVACPATLDEAWAAARLLLDERGYPLAAPDMLAIGKKPALLERVTGGLAELVTPARATRDEDGGRRLETGWREGRRYRLTGSASAPGCHLTFLAIREDPHERLRDAWEAPRRDPGLALELLRRLAPDEAARIAPPGGTP
jgi:hypothetical protein